MQKHAHAHLTLFFVTQMYIFCNTDVYFLHVLICISKMTELALYIFCSVFSNIAVGFLPMVDVFLHCWF